LSLKGAKSPTRGRKPRSTGTKARAHVSDGPNSLIELKKQLEARTRELAEARGHLSEALEQQSATSEVLRVISSSPGELEPVFQAMLENAVRICEAKFGTMYRYDGDMFHPTAVLNAPPTLSEFLQQRGAFQPPPATPSIACCGRKVWCTVLTTQLNRCPAPRPNSAVRGRTSPYRCLVRTR
jgi:hypothetical protein